MSRPSTEISRSLPAPSAALAAGAVTGALVVGNPIGFGLLLSALAVVAAVELQRPRPPDAWSFLHGGLAVALTATAVVSSAG